MLHLRNLGVVYGHVNQRGWAKLQQELSGSDAVSGSQTLRPIRGMKPRPDVATAPEVSWGLERIGAPALWKQGLTGQGVLAGHLDTGVDGGHPALAGAIHEYAEFDATGNRVPGASVTDSGDHGTHTAGIIAGRRVGNRAIGVAPGCQLVSGMIMEGGDVLARVLGGVDWMLQFPVKVLNLSLGFPGYFDEYVPLLNRIRQRGILPVFAVGNEGPGSSRSPGNYANCVSVGAIDERGDVDPNSSSERFRRRSNPLVPDLVLPGVDIVSANATGGFRSDSGTSMAAPHASQIPLCRREGRLHAMHRPIVASSLTCRHRSPRAGETSIAP